MTTAPGAIPVVFLGGPGIEYAERPPPAALAPWVAATWTVRATCRSDLRVLPDGCVDLIGGDVVGPFTAAVVARFEAGDEASGIRLRPGAFPPLFGVPAHELRDARVAVADLLRRPARLAELAAAAPPPDPLAEAAMRSRDIDDLVRESGWHDEAHMANDVRALAGATPHALLG